MESRKWKVLWVVFLLVFLISCASQAKPTPDVPLSISPAASATRTPKPTRSPYPTWSPMPTFTDMPPKICDKAALVNFLRKNKIKVIATLSPESTPSPLARYCDYRLSPDGMWVVFLEMNEVHGASIEFIQVYGNKHWLILSDVVHGRPYRDDTFYVSHWDVDGKYAYISPGYFIIFAKPLPMAVGRVRRFHREG